MKTIYKYPIQVTDTQAIVLHAGAQVLCVQVQRGEPCIWAMVDDGAPVKPRQIRVYGTGQMLPATTNDHRYIGTFQLHDQFVFHAFEVAS